MGEEITFNYSTGLKGRLLRWSILNKGWYFLCGCDRGHKGEAELTGGVSAGGRGEASQTSGPGD